MSQPPNGISIGLAFCRAHERDQQTGTQTDEPRYSVCRYCPYLIMQRKQCGLKCVTFSLSAVHTIRLFKIVRVKLSAVSVGLYEL